MDADLPAPDRVDLDPHEVNDEAFIGQDLAGGGEDLGGEDLAGGAEEVGLVDSSGAVEPLTAADPVVTAEAAVADAAQEQPAPVPEAAATEEERLDLDAITADLEGVEVALARLGEGTYWTDEVTGEPLPDELLAAHPTARRA